MSFVPHSDSKKPQIERGSIPQQELEITLSEKPIDERDIAEEAIFESFLIAFIIIVFLYAVLIPRDGVDGNTAFSTITLIFFLVLWLLLSMFTYKK